MRETGTGRTRSRSESRNFASAVALIIVFAVTTSLVDSCTAPKRPGAPHRTLEDAANWAIPAEGLLITVRQRDSEWLPGGKHKLHLDDITGRQVLLSITDSLDKVVHGPKSTKVGEKITVGEVTVEPVRLKNLLVGEDFGEFRVTRNSGGPGE